ncbi:hemolysin activation/secretion protein [Sphingomonas sp. BE138]|uniref:ShlB/FhaC/HecB family hemolysin secretion/activation protein n=1 Tax=Sphingomonas sp. BE138 TaxID=2817845 RepID=UPI002864CB24|nr:ShlB/FhaC/HecB family hemolysin secretion/activation protein [Sphingomonas sp. BE138]MDR6787592.1 hemolysin activation/secretion protein [Sphingomonas sp. BE138]
MARIGTWSVLAALVSQGAAAQTALDRADPRLIERTLPEAEAPPHPAAPAPAAPLATVAAAPARLTEVVRAVIVDGRDRLSPALFADPIARVIGQRLDREQVGELAGAIAKVARDRGYPFATAQVPAQPQRDGVLHVTLDLGRIDAVRVIGARNAAADRLLARALATGAPVRTGQLERALLLVGDVPGVRVTDSRLVRQDGFGILLVTIEQDRASGYVQLDNRGSKEIGPFRSTALASLRGLSQDGDELALIVSQTPFSPTEFTFARARYGAPVGSSGAILSASGSLARTRPGGFLRMLDVRGRSADAAVALQYPLLRTRARSLWATAELRALGTDQDLARRRLRSDRIATLTGTLGGNMTLAGGTLRAELATIAGLPVAGTTREGSPLGSRFDGDARFVAGTYLIDWTVTLGKPFSMVLASAGQLSSRPLLAAMEIGLGGPAFGRGYDYAERTGDKGVMGSLELRADTGRIPGSVVDRGQLYGFVDGGTVGNLRGGFGGGSLASTGLGMRIGTGRVDWMAEVAWPLTADRFDTGDRRPRVSVRVARAF